MNTKTENPASITRREFAAGVAALAACPVRTGASDYDGELAQRQREIDDITPADFVAYYRPGLSLAADRLEAAKRRFPVL